MAKLEELYPLRTKPNLARPIWGGHRLARDLKKSDDPHDVLGESWEVHEDNPIENGLLRGRSLQDAVKEWGTTPLVGSKAGPVASQHFPLLIKLIDAADQLSIQVHPNDTQAQLLESQPYGKTEAWHILDAAPGSRLVYGLARELSRSRLKQEAADGTIEHSLQYLQVHPGDTVTVPAGTIHAIGAGIFLYEVQQSSTTTYRLYDWGRAGPDGRRRELHLNKGCAVALLDVRPNGLCSPVTIEEMSILRRILVSNEYFALERWILTDSAALPLDGSTFLAITVIAGRATIESRTGRFPTEHLGWGDSVVVPAALQDGEIRAVEGPTTMLVARLP